MFFTKSNKYQLSKAAINCSMNQLTVDITPRIAIFDILALVESPFLGDDRNQSAVYFFFDFAACG